MQNRINYNLISVSLYMVTNIINITNPAIYIHTNNKNSVEKHIFLSVIDKFQNVLKNGGL